MEKEVKVKVNVMEFLKTMTTGSMMVQKNHVVPIMENVLVSLRNNKGYVTSCNTETSITSRCNAEFDKEMEFLINGKDVTGVLKTLNSDSDVFFRISEKSCIIDYLTGSAKFPIYDTKDFISLVTEDDMAFFRLNSEMLFNTLKRAKAFTINDDVRPMMGGVRIKIGDKKLRISSTDANILYDDTFDFDVSSESRELVVKNTVIPCILNMINQTENVKIGCGNNNIVIRTADCKIITRKIHGIYPNIDAVIPKNFRIELKVNKKDLLNALNRLMITANATTKFIKFDIKGNDMKLTSEDVEFSKSMAENFNGVANGGDITIGMNGVKLETCLTGIDSDNVIFRMNDNMRAVVIKDEVNTERTILIMPVRIE